MNKSGLADSPFFTTPEKPTPLALPPETSARVPQTASETKPAKQKLQASKQIGNQESMHTRMDESIIELIRRAVKDVGKESATFRFTPEEKKALLELTFIYKVQGYKTSENELTRIAINFILENHKQNGRNSILEKVLQALNQ